LLFNSFEYLLFFLSVLIFAWSSVRFPVFRICVLLLANYYFYASNNYWLIVVFFITTQIDYWCAVLIEDASSQRRKKILLYISVVSNLGILCFFKYCNFFAQSAVGVANFFGLKLDWVDLNIVLPLGISFYTFQSLSYTIDVFRGEIKAVRFWPKFSFFISFFPHIIAGPIIRPHYFLPQLDNKPIIDKQRFDSALIYIFRGLLKKIVFGDFLATYADQAFDYPLDTDILSTWIGVYAFTFQIYFDFSGYSDIAIGCARLMGYEIPENFNRPYVSKSITEFWRRWHMSLSFWLRDYLYIPLGGNRVDKRYKIYRNLMITMLLGGLWHGAAWHFVVWGGLQGLMLCIEKYFEIGISKNNNRFSFKNFILIILVFHFAVFSWIIFRANSTDLLMKLFSGLFTFDRSVIVTYGLVIATGIMLIGFINQLVDEYTSFTQWYFRQPVYLKTLFFSFVTFAIAFYNFGEAKQFIYFQF
jgi:alginate O-acetyltransferase complex protein AlgI